MAARTQLEAQHPFVAPICSCQSRDSPRDHQSQRRHLSFVISSQSALLLTAPASKWEPGGSRLAEPQVPLHLPYTPRRAHPCACPSSTTALLHTHAAPCSTRKADLLLWPSVRWVPSIPTKGCPGLNERQKDQPRAVCQESPLLATWWSPWAQDPGLPLHLETAGGKRPASLPPRAGPGSCCDGRTHLVGKLGHPARPPRPCATRQPTGRGRGPLENALLHYLRAWPFEFQSRPPAWAGVLTWFAVGLMATL